jgi:hypothetical protein
MMSEKRRKKGLVFMATLAGCGVLALALGTFSERVAAQATRVTVSDAELDMALRRALPGMVEAHGSIGPGRALEGRRGFGVAARTVDMRDIPQLIRTAKIVEGEEHADRPISGLTDVQYDALKARVARQLAAGEIGTRPSPLATKVTPRLGVGPKAPGATGLPNSVGANVGFFGQSENGLDPPDMALAVSENYVVQLVNSAIAVYDKKGNLMPGFPKDFATFMGQPGVFMFDPRAFYDWANRRFFLLMDTWSTNGSGVNVGGLVWAVSRTNDPTGSWYIYPTFTGAPLGTGVCGDFPTLGHDTTNWGTYATQGGIYIGVNVWTTQSSCTPGHYSFTSNGVFFIPKDAIYSGAGFAYWQFNGITVNSTLVDTLQPYNVTDRADKPSSIFLVNSYNYNWGGGLCSTGCNDLDVWSVSGPTTANGSVPANPNNPFQFLQGGNGPILTLKGLATTHTYTLPPNASSPNCKAASSPCIDTDYTFISGQVKYHAGEMYASLNTGVSGSSPAVAGPLWFQFHPIVSNNNSQLTSVEAHNEDCFLCGGWANNGSAFYATLQPDQENNVLMVFAYSTDTVYPSGVYTSRRVTFGDNLMDGAGTYLEGGQASVTGRWGDYSATAPDFTNATRGLLWFSVGYAPSSGSWGTVIGAAQYSTASNQ